MFKVIQVIAFLSVFFLISCSSENNSKKSLSDYSLVDSKDKKLKINLAVSNLMPDGSKTTSSKRVQRINNSDNLFEKFDIENVFLDVQSIEAHTEEDGWIVLDNRTQRIDLLELQNGVASMLFNDVMPVGTYTQIRLMLGEKSEIRVAGYPYHLEIPSGEQTGVKLVSSFEIQEGKVVEIKLKIDLASTLGYVFGKGFSMKPTIKIEGVQEVDAGGKVKAEGGSVSTEDGKVTLSIPENALQNEVLITIEELNATAVGGERPATAVSAGDVYRFGPDGQTFEKPIVVAFAYDKQKVRQMGAEKNLYVSYLNPATNKWEKIRSFVSTQSNIVYAQINHFSDYSVDLNLTCSDGSKNYDETGVDCGGSCVNECINCLVPEDIHIERQGPSYGLYSMDNNIFEGPDGLVAQAYHEYVAFNEEINGTDQIVTADQKLAAAAHFVNLHMGYMFDANETYGDGSWKGIQTPERTVSESPTRIGLTPANDTPVLCTTITTKSSETHTARFCGDCEDFAILRASLARHMGVAARCIYNANYSEGLNHPYDPAEDNESVEEDTATGTGEWTTENNISCLHPFAEGCTDATAGGDPAAYDWHDYYHATDAEDRIAPEGSGLFDDVVKAVEDTYHEYVGDPIDDLIECTFTTDCVGSSATSQPAVDIALEDENDIVEVTAPENIPEEEPLQGFFEGNASGGHAFNVVVYQNKYRIMDYYELGKYFKTKAGSTPNKWSLEHHRPSNVWNDENGTYNALPWHNKDWINPAKVIQNRVLGQKCYEPGKTYWSSKTLYEDVCP